MVKDSPIVDPTMLIGGIGLLVIVIFMFNGTINQTWGFTLGLFFCILLLSSVFSMSPEIPAYTKKKKR